MLQLLDIALFLLHCVVILFNCLGWMWRRTRRLHLWVICLTAGSWFILGIWYGWGYCFLTDWAWRIKRQLGETGLPNSFIQYMFDQIGIAMSPSTTDTITSTVFAVSVLIALYVNVRDYLQRRKGEY